MEPADAAHVARAFWRAIEARAWDEVEGYLHEDVVVDWPQSRELIRGRANWLALNRNYPGDWHVDVERVEPTPHGAVTVVRASVDGAVEYATSFLDIRDGRITRAVEYWAAEYAAPGWRAAWVEALE